MSALTDAFVRLKDGEWFCRAPLSIDTPGGVIEVTPGVVYRRGHVLSGFDVARLLDEWQASGRLPPNITLR